MKKDNHCATLPDKYQEFYRRIRTIVPEERLLCGPLHTLAYGTDASFYRLTPKIVVKARTEHEVSELLKIASKLKTPVTFRAAGTSLAGQAISDSVLIYLAGGWRKHTIKKDGAAISLQPGVVGGDANYYLAPLGKKIGPDPASINAAMIGGIAANNASGMCCGTAENSYKTVESMKLIFADGSMLDTADAASREAFRASHKDLIAEIERMRDEIKADQALTERIRRKFKIKNTTGYGINSFIDFEDPFDIIVHLMIGSEGTLGFISEITYLTVIEHKFKASALIIFPHIENACHATIRLKQGPAAAVELMDRPALRSVENKGGMPSFLKELGKNVAALLVETRASDTATLLKQIEELIDLMTGIPTVFPITFMDKAEDYNKLWNIRKGLFPSVGGARKIGTTVVIEDVVFPIEVLSEGTLELQALMQKHGYPEGIIFGHALDGNLHFVFCPDLADPDSVRRYKALLDEVCDIVVKKYDGSLKGEHGTGRNMAPFVELEWGNQAYMYMRRLKNAFDPDTILNPGVVINDNPNVYVEDLKPMPAVNEIIDKCIECGFCEPVCPSKNITTTPRQRITTQREISPDSVLPMKTTSS
ncbi:MAG TPA: FAD-binding and (Fe-S)-binding domain-containing protein [Dissulfurispiraceae bacterium]|nr:FAD-binding and (Fe-S)-binding domain-containing protein [Dissulfurispiraceae bacterium]